MDIISSGEWTTHAQNASSFLPLLPFRLCFYAGLHTDVNVCSATYCSGVCNVKVPLWRVWAVLICKFSLFLVGMKTFPPSFSILPPSSVLVFFRPVLTNWHLCWIWSLSQKIQQSQHQPQWWHNVSKHSLPSHWSKPMTCYSLFTCWTDPQKPPGFLFRDSFPRKVWAVCRLQLNTDEFPAGLVCDGSGPPTEDGVTEIRNEGGRRWRILNSGQKSRVREEWKRGEEADSSKRMKVKVCWRYRSETSDGTGGGGAGGRAGGGDNEDAKVKIL